MRKNPEENALGIPKGHIASQALPAFFRKSALALSLALAACTGEDTDPKSTDTLDTVVDSDPHTDDSDTPIETDQPHTDLPATANQPDSLLPNFKDLGIGVVSTTLPGTFEDVPPIRGLITLAHNLAWLPLSDGRFIATGHLDPSNCGEAAHPILNVSTWATDGCLREQPRDQGFEFASVIKNPEGGLPWVVQVLGTDTVVFGPATDGSRDYERKGILSNRGVLGVTGAPDRTDVSGFLLQSTPANYDVVGVFPFNLDPATGVGTVGEMLPGTEDTIVNMPYIFTYIPNGENLGVLVHYTGDPNPTTDWTEYWQIDANLQANAYQPHPSDDAACLAIQGCMNPKAKYSAPMGLSMWYNHIPGEILEYREGPLTVAQGALFTGVHLTINSAKNPSNPTYAWANYPQVNSLLVPATLGTKIRGQGITEVNLTIDKGLYMRQWGSWMATLVTGGSKESYVTNVFCVSQGTDGGMALAGTLYPDFANSGWTCSMQAAGTGAFPDYHPVSALGEPMPSYAIQGQIDAGVFYSSHETSRQMPVPADLAAERGDYVDWHNADARGHFLALNGEGEAVLLSNTSTNHFLHLAPTRAFEIGSTADSPCDLYLVTPPDESMATYVLTLDPLEAGRPNFEVHLVPPAGGYTGPGINAESQQPNAVFVCDGSDVAANNTALVQEAVLPVFTPAL